MSDDVNVIVHVDTDQPMRELADFENEINKKATLWQRVKRTIMTESRQVLQSVLAGVRSIQGILRALNISVGPIGDVIIQLGVAVLNYLIAVQYAYTASGPIGWALLGLSFGALVASAYAIGQSVDAVGEARRAARDAEAVMNNVSAILSPWR